MPIWLNLMAAFQKKLFPESTGLYSPLLRQERVDECSCVTPTSLRRHRVTGDATDDVIDGRDVDPPEPDARSGQLRRIPDALRSDVDVVGRVGVARDVRRMHRLLPLSQTQVTSKSLIGGTQETTDFPSIY